MLRVQDAPATAREQRLATQRTDRIRALNERRRDIDAELPAAERAYERALARRRMDGLEAAGDRLMRMILTLQRIDRELRDLDA